MSAPALVQKVKEQLNREAVALGISVVDVRIRRADLPEQNSQAIYQRMQTERQREAAEYRAQGVEASERIKARADRDVVVTKAEADRQARETLGAGDAERTQAAGRGLWSRCSEFFSFWRSMQAYEAWLKSAGDPHGDLARQRLSSAILTIRRASYGGPIRGKKPQHKRCCTGAGRGPFKESSSPSGWCSL
jgi:HflC protein